MKIETNRPSLPAGAVAPDTTDVASAPARQPQVAQPPKDAFVTGARALTSLQLPAGRGAAPSAAAEAHWAGATAQRSTPTVPQTDIEPGATGEAVKQLQDCLVALGYMTQAQVNTGYGRFGPMTLAAVKKLQADHGIEQVGRFGPKTRAAMEQALGGGQPPPVEPSGVLTNAPNHPFTFQQLWPYIQKYANKYGMDAKVLSAIIYQESGFKNYRVHRDGTGHGLLGLDDNGMLPGFEKWSGMRVGRGQNAVSIPPEKQIEYAAMAMAQMSRRHGNDPYAAARQWHRGPGLMNDALGRRYESLIRAHIRRLFG